MPQNIIQGVKVDGVIYKYDYESLENLPDPELPGYSESADDGKVLSVSNGSGLVWSHPGEKLPEYDNGDEGKLLAVANSSLEWTDYPLPEYSSSDQGKLLAVANTGLEWTDYPLPEYSYSDQGKLLAVANTGLEWIEPQSSIPNYDNGDSGKTLMVNDTGDDIVWRSPFPDRYDETNVYLHYNENGDLDWNSPLPNYNSFNSGTYLRVDSVGDLEWASMDNSFPSTDECTGGEALVVGTSDNAYALLWRKLLPDFSGQDYGKALLVGGSDDLPELVFKQILPSWSGSDDAGKVLTIDANGHLSWQMPS